MEGEKERGREGRTRLRRRVGRWEGRRWEGREGWRERADNDASWVFIWAPVLNS